MVGVSGAAQIRRVASMPSISGIRTSISTTSGRICSARATASAPVPASPTTVRSGARSTSTRKLPRSSAWSSAISTRTLTLPRKGCGRRHAKPPPERGPAVNVAAVDGDPLPHPEQPWPAAPGAAAPGPSSVTSTRTSPGSTTTVTRQWAGAACLTTLVSASCTIR